MGLRNRIVLFVQTGIALLMSVALVAAQATCDVDLSDVVNQVEGVCSEISDNQVCYGNFEVNAVVQDNAPAQNFEAQGDLAEVAFIRSLFLSGLDPDTERWGIAQMRLVTATSTGNQDINLLLFGDVQIDNAVEQTPTLDIVVGEFAANVRNSPRDNALILDSIPSGEILEAVGRLADNSWLRVTLADGSIGWVFNTLVSPADEAASFDVLDVQDSATPYFGPMQAFSFTDGGESQCGNVTTDGLLIQTPEGSARVTLLINEVAIELLPGVNGATAVVTGNATTGMNISVVDGEAVVSANGESFFVGATEETNIPLSADLVPISGPSVPAAYDVDQMSGLPVLPIIRTANLPIVPLTTGGTTTNGGTSTGTVNTGGEDTGGGGGNANGNANGNRGNANGNANGNGNGNRNGKANG